MSLINRVFLLNLKSPFTWNVFSRTYAKPVAGKVFTKFS